MRGIDGAPERERERLCVALVARSHELRAPSRSAGSRHTAVALSPRSTLRAQLELAPSDTRTSQAVFLSLSSASEHERARRSPRERERAWGQSRSGADRTRPEPPKKWPQNSGTFSARFGRSIVPPTRAVRGLFQHALDRVRPRPSPTMPKTQRNFERCRHGSGADARARRGAVLAAPRAARDLSVKF